MKRWPRPRKYRPDPRGVGDTTFRKLLKSRPYCFVRAYMGDYGHVRMVGKIGAIVGVGVDDVDVCVCMTSQTRSKLRRANRVSERSRMNSRKVSERM